MPLLLILIGCFSNTTMTQWISVDSKLKNNFMYVNNADSLAVLENKIMRDCYEAGELNHLGIDIDTCFNEKMEKVRIYFKEDYE